MGQGRLKVASDPRSVAEVAETTVKRLLCCGFRRTGKVRGQVYQCWCRICRRTNVFSRFEYHMFYVLYPFVTCVLSLRRIFEIFQQSGINYVRVRLLWFEGVLGASTLA
jgi:hypothetical protein